MSRSISQGDEMDKIMKAYCNLLTQKRYSPNTQGPLDNINV